jgi:hypothetical protein
VAPESIEDYEQRVQPARSLLNNFYKQLITELDVSSGAFRWWEGHSDWKTLTLLADYLIQSVSGAAEALLAASYAAKTHEEDAVSLHEDYSKAMHTASGPDDLLKALDLEGKGKERELRINHSSEHCFFHLSQALDRLAAALAIVGVIGDTDVATIYFTQVQALANVANKQANDSLERVEPLGTLGRAAQIAMLTHVNSADDYGPADWLTWLRDSRNAATHRSPSIKPRLGTHDRIVTIFYRQPKWSEKQTFIFGKGPPPNPLIGCFIPSSSVSILNGMCDSMAKFVAAITADMTACWQTRRANPGMVIQRGRQWPVIQPPGPPSVFAGYDQDIDLAGFSGGALMLNPNDAKRFSAARAMDDRSDEWRS